MKSLVQSPAREIAIRNPGAPATGITAKLCHCCSGCRAIDRVEPAIGRYRLLLTSATCDDGRITSTGIRRSNSHGNSELIVVTVSTTIAGALPSWIALIQNNADNVQPPNRCTRSNRSWCSARNFGREVITIPSRSED